MEEKIIETLKKLIKDTPIKIIKVSYDKEAFGNIFLLLNFKNEFKIKFINDRGDFFCDICKNNECFFIEDIFKVIKKEYTITKTDFIDMLKQSYTNIVNNEKEIIVAFQENNIEKTKAEIKLFQKARTIKWE